MKTRSLVKERCLHALIALLPLLCLVPITSLAANPYLQAAKHAFSLREWEQSYLLFQKVMEEEPENGVSLFYMGYIREQQNKRAEAVHHYQQAIVLELEENLKKKAFWKIVLYYKKIYDWENLLLYADKFLEFHEHKAVHRLKELAQSHYNPEKMQVKLLLQQALEKKQQGLLEEAILSLNNLLALYPSYEKAHWELALLKMRKQDFKTAINHLGLLVQTFPNNWQYQYKASVCYYRLGQHDQALFYLKKTQELYTGDREEFNFYTSYMKGDIYLQQQQFEQALDYLLAANKLRNITALEASIAYSYWHLGQQQEARQYAQASVTKEPKQAIGYLVLALQNYQNQQIETAYQLTQQMENILLSDAKQATKNAKIDSLGFLLLGQKAITQKEWEKALSFLIKVNPKTLNIFTKRVGQTSPLQILIVNYERNLADSLMYNDKPREALYYYQKLEKTSEILFASARCHASLFHSDQAKSYLQQAAQRQREFWQLAWQDKAFQQLMEQDLEFQSFLSQQLTDSNAKQNEVQYETRKLTNTIQYETRELINETPQQDAVQYETRELINETPKQDADQYGTRKLINENPKQDADQYGTRKLINETPKQDADQYGTRKLINENPKQDAVQYETRKLINENPKQDAVQYETRKLINETPKQDADQYGTRELINETPKQDADQYETRKLINETPKQDADQYGTRELINETPKQDADHQ